MKSRADHPGHDMVLRVARAIQDDDGPDAMTWTDLNSEQFAVRLKQARAAIAAMRKPTDTMLLAAIRLDPKCLIEQQWPAMVDAALTA